MRWNFSSRAVNTVYENQTILLECIESIQSSQGFDLVTIREAKGFSHMLSDPEFLFFLDLFYLIMPNVDILYAQLQKRVTDAVESHRVTRSQFHWQNL